MKYETLKGLRRNQNFPQISLESTLDPVSIESKPASSRCSFQFKQEISNALCTLSFKRRNALKKAGTQNDERSLRQKVNSILKWIFCWKKIRPFGAIDFVDPGPIFEDSFKSHISSETELNCEKERDRKIAEKIATDWGKEKTCPLFAKTFLRIMDDYVAPKKYKLWPQVSLMFFIKFLYFYLVLSTSVVK